jgi:hypothetical protein
MEGWMTLPSNEAHPQIPHIDQFSAKRSAMSKKESRAKENTAELFRF